MAISVRTAAGTDLPAILALLQELHPDDPVLDVADATPIWRRIADQTGRVVLLAEVDGEPAGTLDCTTLPNLTRGGRPFMLVENVVTAAAHRRRGVGRALVDEVVARARLEQCYKIQLLTRAERDEAHAFYEAAGFTASARGFRMYLTTGGSP